MSYPTTQKAQLAWIFQETGRQLATPITATIRKIRNVRESQELDRFMEETLIDPGLIDRILDGNEEPDPGALFVEDVPEKEPKTIFNPIPRKSLDGIFAR
jgi:hypothetical protein